MEPSSLSASTMKAALRGSATRQLISRRAKAPPLTTPLAAIESVRFVGASSVSASESWCHRHRRRTCNNDSPHPPSGRGNQPSENDYPPRCALFRRRLPSVAAVTDLGGSAVATSHFLARRFRSTVAAIEGTPLHGPRGAALLRGLDLHTVPAEDDGHPLSVYTMGGECPPDHRDDRGDDGDDAGRRGRRRRPRMPILLLHGRTWSSVPVYHLARRDDGGNVIDGGTTATTTGAGGEDRSLIRALYDTGRVRPYAMDFRGFGGTPRDGSGYAEPLKCVTDAISVLNWIHREGRRRDGDERGGGTVAVPRPALLGWSHGALIAQIIAQRHSDSISKLILYGSTYSPNVRYSIPPPAAGIVEDEDDDFPLHLMTARNEYDGAMEDFTSVGDGGGDEARIFPPASARLFAEAALVSDPIKVKWHNLHQLNECHPSLVKVPTMVIAGDQDPYAPMLTQAELFTNLGRGVDRIWTIIANADHAVHLSDERHRFVENVDNFLEAR